MVWRPDRAERPLLVLVCIRKQGDATSVPMKTNRHGQQGGHLESATFFERSFTWCMKASNLVVMFVNPCPS